MTILYRHTQVGKVILVSLIAGMALLVVLSVMLGWHPVSIVALGILLACAFVFTSLTVEISTERLECRFGTGLIRKRFVLSDIRNAEAVRNRWYYGWGIRYTPHGWLFNVSGLDAVEITLASGRKFRIGTDEPEKLVTVLRQSADLDR